MDWIKWTAEIILELLKVLLSPQVVVGVVAIVFFCKFKKDISDFMGRIKKMPSPWGDTELEEQPALSDKESAVIVLDETPKVKDEVTVEVTSLENMAAFVEKLKAELKGSQRISELWEFNYLNHFLVSKTKANLEFIYRFNNVPTTKGPIGDVLNALTTYGLVEITAGTGPHNRDKDIISITDKGRSFLHWYKPNDFPDPYGPISTGDSSQ